MDSGEPRSVPVEDDVVLVQPRPRSSPRRVAVRVFVAVVAVLAVVVAFNVLRANAPGVASGGDWSGQFTRCGEPVADVVTAGSEPVAELDVSLLDSSTTVGVHGQWTSAVTASSADPTAQGWVYGTDLTLARDGVVVAVQDGPQVPQPQQVDEWGGNYAVAPLPLVSDVSLGFASCDQYLHGTGSPQVAPGTYDLFASQTVGLRGDDGTTAGAWGVAVTTVTVVADGEAVDQDPTACGAPTDGLEVLASQEGNPAPLGLEVLSGGEGLVVRVSNTGTAPIVATTGHPTVVIVRDGVVVGGLDAHEDVGLAADLAVGGHADYDAATNAVDCTTVGVGEHADTGDGDPLPPGEYEVWAVMSFFGDGLPPTRSDRPGTLVAGGPASFTID